MGRDGNFKRYSSGIANLKIDLYLKKCAKCPVGGITRS